MTRSAFWSLLLAGTRRTGQLAAPLVALQAAPRRNLLGFSVPVSLVLLRGGSEVSETAWSLLARYWALL